MRRRRVMGKQQRSRPTSRHPNRLLRQEPNIGFGVSVIINPPWQLVMTESASCSRLIQRRADAILLFSLAIRRSPINR